jgi:hypothetical protein
MPGPNRSSQLPDIIRKGFTMRWKSVRPWQRRALLAVAVLCSVLVVWRGCFPRSELAAFLENEVVYGEVDDERFGVIIASREGDWVAVARDGRSLVYTAPGGQSATIYVNEAGLPTRIIDGGLIFELNGYENGTVDVAIVLPDGSIKTFRDVALPEQVRELRPTGEAVSADLLQLAARSADAEEPKPGDVTVAVSADIALELSGEFRLSDAVMLTGIAIATAAAIVPLATGAAVGVAAGALALGAVSVGLSIASLETGNAAYTASDVALGTFLCATSPINPVGGAANCVTTALTVANEVWVKDWELQKERESATRLAKSALVHGTGDVQITLTWQTPTDVDLWCTDPNGESIGYRHMRSNSGGRLDVDDRNGYGPENIFWARGRAPAGAYVVHVHHYRGDRPAPYQVLLKVDGREETFEGTLAPKQRNVVKMFTR